MHRLEENLKEDRHDTHPHHRQEAFNRNRPSLTHAGDHTERLDEDDYQDADPQKQPAPGQGPHKSKRREISRRVSCYHSKGPGFIGLRWKLTR